MATPRPGPFGICLTRRAWLQCSLGASLSLSGWLPRLAAQTANDPQWPTYSPVYGTGAGAGAIAFGNFAINPLNGMQGMISSNAGRVFATTNGGDIRKFALML